MPAAQVATVANPLIDRLNSIRMRRFGTYGQELDQIKFRAHGLRIADRASYHAVMGMMAVVEGNADALRDAGSNLAAEFPDDIHCHLNILRSYVSMRLRSDARDLAQHLSARIGSASEAAAITVCSLHNGDLEGTDEMASRFLQSLGQGSVPSEISTVAESLEISRKLLDSGVTSQELCAFIDCAIDALGVQGWAVPNMSIDLPMTDLEGEIPIALVRFFVDSEGDFEDVLDAEGALMDSLIAANDQLFASATLCVSIGNPFDE